MLEYQSVSIGYRGEPVLKEISVRFPARKITAIVGPNGCGKTTLVQCLIGASRLTAGRILLDGKDLSAVSPRERARKIAFLPQMHASLPAISVRLLTEHGRFPYMGFGRKASPEDRRAVEEAMAQAQVRAYADERVDTLSGGVRQRAFLAMLLAQNAPVLVFDEPTTYLDIRGQVEFLSLLRGLRAEGRTILVVLHDLNQAAQIADRVVLMQDRKIAACGSCAECLTEQRIAAVFGVSCRGAGQGGENWYRFGPL